MDLSQNKQLATVRVSVDFPGAENVWIAVEPVFAGHDLQRALDGAVSRLMNALALDAGRLAAEIRPYREAKKLLETQ